MYCVSVIIPTFNHGDFIVDTLESVFAQTYQDYEVIVVNDGSPDDTEVVLRPYIEAQRIRYLCQENQGVAASRNAGLALARGEWIAFLDDDDLWPTDKLAWQVACLESSNAVMVGGLCSLFGDAKDRKMLLTSHDFKAFMTPDLFKSNPFGSPGQTLIRKSALNQIGGFDPLIWGVDDMDLWIRLSKIGEIRRYQKVALFYRAHDANASLDILRMAQNMEAVIRKNVAGLTGLEKRSSERSGYRFLFRYTGKKLLWKGAQRIARGQAGDGLAMMRESFLIFLPRFRRDPWLICSFVLAIFKIPLKMRTIR
jgi:glycosyltransferase involved in cell wall biosynthesis